MVNFESFFRLKKHRPAEVTAERAGLRGVLEAAGAPEDTGAQFQREASPRESSLGGRSDAEITTYLAKVEADVRAMNTSLSWQEDELVVPALAEARVATAARSQEAGADLVAPPPPAGPVAEAAPGAGADLADASAYFSEAADVDAAVNVEHVGSYENDLEDPVLEHAAKSEDAPITGDVRFPDVERESDAAVALTQAATEYERGNLSMDATQDGPFYDLGDSLAGSYEPSEHAVAATPSSYDADYGTERASEGPSSARLAEFAAFRSIADDLEEKLRSFAETVSMSRLTAQSMTPFLSKIEADIQMAEEVERERDLLAGDLHDARRALEQSERDLDARSAALDSAVERAEELQADLDQRRVAHQDLLARYERLRKEHERALSDAAEARVEIVRLTAAIARETAEKESYYRSRVEIANKFAKLQQAEAQARNKYLELTIQYEKIAKTQPQMVAEQERLRNELRASQREVASLQNRLLAAQDRTTQLETEMQALQGFSASEAYSTRTELEMQKSALRVAEKAIAESELSNKDMQRQLRDAEAARSSLEEQLAELQNELKAVRDERADAAFKLSDVNLKYMADLLALDQQREQNKEFQNNIETLLSEKQRLGRFEALYKAAEGQIVSLKEKLGLLAENLKDSTDPEKLRRSLEIIGELTAPHVAANTDKPPRGTGRKVATH